MNPRRALFRRPPQGIGKTRQSSAWSENSGCADCDESPPLDGRRGRNLLLGPRSFRPAAGRQELLAAGACHRCRRGCRRRRLADNTSALPGAPSSTIQRRSGWSFACPARTAALRRRRAVRPVPASPGSAVRLRFAVLRPCGTPPQIRYIADPRQPGVVDASIRLCTNPAMASVWPARIRHPFPHCGIYAGTVCR